MAAKITSRHTRVGLELAVDVSGRDARAHRFFEGTRTLNVSGGGICFESRHNLLVGARVDLNISVPPKLRAKFGGRATYRVRALVCRVERPLGEDIYRVGARFLGEI
jgi:hypothetical protein